MDETKRILRRVAELPCNQLTGWEQGFLYGATASGFQVWPVVQRLEAKLRAYEEKYGAIKDLPAPLAA